MQLNLVVLCLLKAIYMLKIGFYCIHCYVPYKLLPQSYFPVPFLIINISVCYQRSDKVRPCTDTKQMAFPSKDNSQGVTVNKIQEKQDETTAGDKQTGSWRETHGKKSQTIHGTLLNKLLCCFLNSPKMYVFTNFSHAMLVYFTY